MNTTWIEAVVVLVVVIGIAWAGAYFMHKHDVKKYDKLNATYISFVEKTKVAGEKAQKEVLAVETANKLKEKKANEENKRTSDALAVANKRLRDARASSSYVPPATPNSKRPEVACFQRTELERAIGQLDKGLSELTTKGDQARIDLNTAKQWATQ